MSKSVIPDGLDVEEDEGHVVVKITLSPEAALTLARRLIKSATDAIPDLTDTPDLFNGEKP